MNANKNELRLTDTNAASDSKGRTWGLDGGLFWWLIGGIGTGIIVFFVLLVGLDDSLATSFLIALVPVGPSFKKLPRGRPGFRKFNCPRRSTDMMRGSTWDWPRISRGNSFSSSVRCFIFSMVVFMAVIVARNLVDDCAA